MQVAYWQLAIVVSITFAFWASRRPALRARTRIAHLPWVLGVLWVGWTVDRIVFSRDLLNLQLFVVSATMIGNLYFAWTLRMARRAEEVARRAQADNAELQFRVTELSAQLDLPESERAALAGAAKRGQTKIRPLATKEVHGSHPERRSTTGTVVAGVAGAAGGVLAVASGVAAGAAAGTAGAAALTSGLASVGGVVGGGLFAGLTLFAAVPLVGVAVGVGGYLLFKVLVGRR